MNLKHLLTNLNPFKKKEAPPQEVSPEPPDEPTDPQQKSKFGKIKSITKNGKEIIFKTHTEEQKYFLVKCIGKMMSPSEIKDCYEEAFGVELRNYSQIINIYRHSEKWQPIIQQYRKEFLAHIDNIPTSHKNVRLSRVDRVFDKATKRGDLKVALSAIEQGRKEMEEKNSNVGVHLTLNQYNLMSDEEIEARLSEVKAKIIDVKPVKEKSDRNDAKEA